MAKSKFERWLTPEGLVLVEGWARDGLTEEQIAHNMGINRDTLRKWKLKYQEIDKAVRKGKEVVDLIVENALYKRAIGFKTEETKVFIMPNGEKRGVQVTKDIPPDTTACIFWLKNRRPDKWRDKPDYVNTETYEDDGLLAALSATVTEQMQDDSWMVEEENEEES